MPRDFPGTAKGKEGKFAANLAVEPIPFKG
jgi:hypothetical protein